MGVRKILVNLLALGILHTVLRVAAACGNKPSQIGKKEPKIADLRRFARLMVLHFRGMRRSTPRPTTFSIVS